MKIEWKKEDIDRELIAFLGQYINHDYSIYDVDTHYRVWMHIVKTVPIVKNMIYVNKETFNWDNDSVWYCDSDETLNNLMNYFGDKCVLVGTKLDAGALYTPQGIFVIVDDEKITYIGEPVFPECVKDTFVFVDPEKDCDFRICTRDGGRFADSIMKVDSFEFDASNYNDDLPYDKLKNILKDDKSGIIIFHGEPGTGKSSLIKSLATDDDLTDNRFIYLDSSCFYSLNEASFISYILNRQNSVFILEDCEDLLKPRDGQNNLLSNLLNLSDGLLGWGLNLKFICTTNCDLSQIDDAVKRKGRLRLIYEFQALTPDKVEALCGKHESMTLAEIYNREEETGDIKPKHAKIGFK